MRISKSKLSKVEGGNMDKFDPVSHKFIKNYMSIKNILGLFFTNS
jgi:hypothetical protein